MGYAGMGYMAAQTLIIANLFHTGTGFAAFYMALHGLTFDCVNSAPSVRTY